MEQLERAVRL